MIDGGQGQHREERADKVGQLGAVETGRYANEIASHTPRGWPVLQSPLRVETSLAPANDRDVRVPADAGDVVNGVSYIFRTRLSVTRRPSGMFSQAGSA